MTVLEVGERVCAGAFLIAGELRGCGLEEAGFVDKKTGIAEKTLLLTYMVECSVLGVFTFAKITRRLPLGDENAERMKQGVQKGASYAFHIIRFEVKQGFIAASMAAAEPVRIDRDSPLGSRAAGAEPGPNP